MKMTKDELRKSNLFYHVNHDDLETPEEWAEYLDSILNGHCSVMEYEGKLELLEIKALVDSIRGLKIEIYSKEHAPPHFHVKSANVDASFTIQDCVLLNGEISNMDFNKILYWYKNGAKQILIDKWNNTRASNCTVGIIRN